MQQEVKTSAASAMGKGESNEKVAQPKCIVRVTVLQKEGYTYITEINDVDPVTSNKLQDLAYNVDKNIWKLRIHLQKPGGLGENLPWTGDKVEIAQIKGFLFFKVKVLRRIYLISKYLSLVTFVS